jgi:hypothetical protein
MHIISFPFPSILYNPESAERHLARSNTPKHPHNQKPASANKPDPTEDGHTIQHNTHVNRSALLLSLISRLIRAATDIDAIDTSSIEDDSRESQVAEHPGEDDSRAETLVIILVLLLRGDVALRSLPFRLESAEFRLVLGVEVGVVGGDCDVDLAAGFDVCRGEFLGLVVALCAPGDVVGVAEGVDVEDVDVSGGEEEVLQEAGGHVPGVEEEDGGEEVEEPGRAHADDEGEEELVGEEHGEGEAAFVDLFHDGFDRDEDRGEEEVSVGGGCQSWLMEDHGECKRTS